MKHALPPMSEDNVPAAIVRRRELFAELRRELDRLTPYPSAVSIGLDEQQIRETLDTVERVLEYAEVAKLATDEAAREDEDHSR